MLSLDEDKLTHELNYVRNELMQRPNVDKIKYVYPAFVSLNNILIALTGYGFDISQIFINHEKVDYIINKKNKNMILEFIKIMDKNQEIFYKTFNSYLNMCDNVGFN